MKLGDLALEDFYFKPKHEENVLLFIKHCQRYPFFECWFPNKPEAPWHLMAAFTDAHNYRQHIHFWPHKLKGMLEGQKPVEGFDELRQLFTKVIDLSTTDPYAEPITNLFEEI